MKLIIIVAIVIIVILIVYLVYLLYNNYFNSRIESSIKNNELEVENSDKKIHKTDNKLHINKSTNTRNLMMTINHNNSNYLIEIELFDKEVPLTCKNFREIAFKGINGKTYNNSIFHRVIKDFMLQGGDIINSNGTGSVSIYGATFRDENFKFKHDQGGLLSMANSGPNTNGSQFFITTTPTPHLDNKHVVFGRVVKGIEHIHTLQNIETNNDDTPLHPVKIISIKEK